MAVSIRSRISNRDTDNHFTSEKNLESGQLSDEFRVCQTQLQTNENDSNRNSFHSCLSSPTASDASQHKNSLSRQSTDADCDAFPEGGLHAWLVVLGAFLGLFPSLGLLNAIGVFQAYIADHQLQNESTGDVGWIFGVFSFLTFFCGVQVGPIFDSRGPRWLILAGSILVVVTTVSLSFCTKYWHFMLVFGVVGGFGASLVYTPAISVVSHWFLERRALATGLAASGGSVGGVVLPLALQKLFPEVGYGWALRAIALICLVTLAIACVLIRSRLPKTSFAKENVLPDFRIFKDPKFAFTTAGVFFIEWGLFIPISYLSSYAQDHNVSTQFSFQLVAIFNAGSSFGRFIPGLCADILGRFNTLIVTVLLCLLSCVCLWLPAGDSVAIMVMYSVIFGFASGSNISLTPVCVGQLCKTENYGRYYATAYTVVSFG